MLEKTLLVEEKQRKRLQEIAMQNRKEKEADITNQLYEGSTTTANSILDQEEAQRKELMDSLVRDSTPDAPVVKVLNNVQGM